MNQVEFEQLYEDEARALFAFLVYRTGDRALAQDLAADTFERVLRARHRYDRRRGPAKAWLYAIAVNVLRDHHRRTGVEARAIARLGAPDPSVEDTHDAILARDALGPALAALSDEEREAVALRFGADMTVREMAAALGERYVTVEGRLYRALRKLRAAMASPAEGDQVASRLGD